MNALTTIASDDDSGGSNTSALTFMARRNTTYWIAVDGWSGAVGNVVLNLSYIDPRDFDGDGQPDLVWRHNSGAICLWLMNGTKLALSSFFSPAQTDPTWKLAGIGDFNQDGKPDLLWRHDGGALCVWYMNGIYCISASMLNPNYANPVWKISAVDDFNQDGKPDLLLRHDNGTMCVWYMNGINKQSEAFLNPASADPKWKIVGTGDFNQDDKPDLVWRDDSGAIGVWYMDGINRIPGVYTVFNPNVTLPNWKISGIGDFNLDGKPDLIWREDGGTIGLWLMNGLGQASGMSFYPGLVDPSWKCF